MSYENRGSYNHPRIAKQLLCFDGLCWDKNATPMDIDCLIEWRNKKRVLIEIKKNNVKVLDGERFALERMINDFGNVGKESIAIVADHKVFDAREDVQVKDCIVREIYHSKERRWRPPKKLMTVEMLVNTFLLGQN